MQGIPELPSNDAGGWSGFSREFDPFTLPVGPSGFRQPAPWNGENTVTIVEFTKLTTISTQSENKMPGRRWTKEQRAELSLAIHRWKPWDHSTGPRTTEGKARAAQNALKHGVRSKQINEYRRMVRYSRKADLFNIAAHQVMEDAREAAIHFVIDRMANTDTNARVTSLEFLMAQSKQAQKNHWKIQTRLANNVRWELYGIQKYRE